MATKTMNVSMGEELHAYVESQVRSGLYDNQSEVVREALRMHRLTTEARTRAVAEFNRELDRGMDQVRQGEVVTAEESARRRKALLKRAAEA